MCTNKNLMKLKPSSHSSTPAVDTIYYNKDTSSYYWQSKIPRLGSDNKYMHWMLTLLTF